MAMRHTAHPPAGRATTRRNLAALLGTGTAVTAASALAVACGAQAGPAGGGAAKLQGTLVIWGWPGLGSNWSHDFGQQMVREFGTTSPNVTVESVDIGAGGNKGDEKLLVAAAGGAPPDIFSTGRSAVAEWGIDGVVKPLDDLMKQSRVVRPDAFLTGLIEEGSWKGKVYGLSHSIDTRAFYWNKEYFRAAGLNPDTPPDTWEAFAASITRTMKRDGGATEVLGYHPTFNSGVGSHYWETWLWELGGRYVTPDGQKVAFNSEAGIKALEWMQRLTNLQGGWDAIEAFYRPLVQATSVRRAGWLLGIKRVSHDIVTGEGVKHLGDTYPDVRYGVGHIPKPANGTRASVRGGYQIVIPSAAKHPDAAWAFTEFHLSNDTQITWNDHLNRIPGTKAAATSPLYLKDDPIRKVFIDVASYSKRIPAIVPGYAEILTLNGQIAPKVLKGEASPRDVLTEYEHKIQTVLDQWQGR
jgi:ABC-type glycerol-3-phosphate transport system substrate-binding protein